MTETARVQYVFLDVVGFTRDRSVEAQSDIVAAINSAVKQAIEPLALPANSTILIPTGDGMAVALLDVRGADTHLQIALEVLKKIQEHNVLSADPMRKFAIRVGINENIDNVIEDVNGRRNVAGAGISMAQRIMDKADAGQVLVGSTVFEQLRQRERYMASFRQFDAQDKHGVPFHVYQYVNEGAPGLVNDPPGAFSGASQKERRLSQFAASYIGIAVANREALNALQIDAFAHPAVILLAFMAEDAVAEAKRAAHERAVVITWGAGMKRFEEQYQHYKSADWWMLARLGPLLVSQQLQPFSECFENGRFGRAWYMPSPHGVRKLVDEWPSIARQYGVSA